MKSFIFLKQCKKALLTNLHLYIFLYIHAYMCLCIYTHAECSRQRAKCAYCESETVCRLYASVASLSSLITVQGIAVQSNGPERRGTLTCAHTH